MTFVQSDRDAAQAMLEHAFRNAPASALRDVAFADIADAFADYRRALLPTDPGGPDVEAAIDAALAVAGQVRRSEITAVDARAMLRALLLPGAANWLPIGRFAGSGPANSVIVAVLCDGRAPVIGEAYFDPEAYGGTWWWAGTAHDDYYDSPIEEWNFGRVAFFQPLPAFRTLQPAVVA